PFHLTSVCGNLSPRAPCNLYPVPCNLPPGYAIQIEFNKLRRIRREPNRSICRLTLNNLRKSSAVDFDGQILGLAKAGIMDQRHGHGVEEYGRLPIPTMIEGGQRACDRRVLMEDTGPACGVE